MKCEARSDKITRGIHIRQKETTATSVMLQGKGRKDVNGKGEGG